jgi:aquaporin Z
MIHKYLVEFLGTMFLVFIVFATGNWLAIGAGLAIGLLLGGPISGGAFNPAVALALYASGKLSKEDLVPYIIVEILGALAAFYLYKYYVNKGAQTN